MRTLFINIILLTSMYFVVIDCMLSIRINKKANDKELTILEIKGIG